MEGDGRSMRIISKSRLIEFWTDHPQSKTALERWYVVADKAQWETIHDVRQAYPHADLVEVGSRRKVTVFNIGGNDFRLVVSIHYNKKRVFIRDVMTHAEYSRDDWKRRH